MILKDAVDLLQNDEIVSIPTETVYGLAGSIYSEKALKKIFAIKNRPFFDPLIIHISSIEEAKSLIKQWHPGLQLMAEKFWPGPLTLVLEKNNKVSNLITAGLSTVALRIPQHSMAIELIKLCGFPLAAPSANKFGKTSPTTAQHVKDEFENIHIIDGGPCLVGLESTILSVEITDENTLNISILRKGILNITVIAELLKEHEITFNIIETTETNIFPGQMKHHYMPNKPLIILNGITTANISLNIIKTELDKLPNEFDNIKIYKPLSVDSFRELILPENPIIAARLLYSKLREASNGKEDIIIFKMEKGHKNVEWEAIVERLLKASTLILN